MVQAIAQRWSLRALFAVLGVVLCLSSWLVFQGWRSEHALFMPLSRVRD